ncbi:tail fiber assembly protein [Escherichia coli]|uniref:tail fiber assembly protein n=1 Tax=Escherichia coli TaxID=562 RepID=UPI003D9C8949
MPADSTDIDPGEGVTGKVAVFSDSGWEWQEDLRGETVYSTEDRSETTVDYIGPVHDGFTRKLPATPYDHWDGEKWITDTAAERDAHIAAAEAKKQFLIDQANVYMNNKQWPGKAAIGRLTGEELAQYNLWLDYLDELEAVDTSSAPDINWPVPPEV